MATTVATFACAIQGEEVPNLDIYTEASSTTCARAIKDYIDPLQY